MYSSALSAGFTVFAGAVALLVAFTIPVRATAATFQPVPNPIGPEMGILIRGPIDTGDAGRFRDAIASAQARYPDHRLRAVGLDSPGGLVNEAVEMAYTIRDHGYVTVVPKGALCASACVVLFASGSMKIASPGSLIGVHGAADAVSGVQTGRALADTTALAQVYAEFGVPASVIGRMVVKPPSEVAWLKAEEIEMFPCGLVQFATFEDIPIMLAGIDAYPDKEAYIRGINGVAAPPHYQSTGQGLPPRELPSSYLLPAPQHTTVLVARVSSYCAAWMMEPQGGAKSEYQSSMEKCSADWFEGYDFAYRTKNVMCGPGDNPGNAGCQAGSEAWPRREPH